MDYRSGGRGYRPPTVNPRGPQTAAYQAEVDDADSGLTYHQWLAVLLLIVGMCALAFVIGFA